MGGNVVNVEEELKKAGYTIEEVKRILNGLKLSGEAWSIVVAGMIHQGIEHHEAILLLIRSKFVGSVRFPLRRRAKRLRRSRKHT